MACRLYSDALEAVRSSLQSTNEVLRLKAAIYVIGKVEMIDVSRQDPEAEIKKLCTRTEEPDWGVVTSYEVLDKDMYNKMMKENGLK